MISYYIFLKIYSSFINDFDDFFKIFILSDPIWSYLVQSDPIWSNLILSDPIWFNLILSGPIWSYLVLSDHILPYLILSGLINFFKTPCIKRPIDCIKRPNECIKRPNECIKKPIDKKQFLRPREHPHGQLWRKNVTKMVKLCTYLISNHRSIEQVSFGSLRSLVWFFSAFYPEALILPLFCLFLIINS